MNQNEERASLTLLSSSIKSVWVKRGICSVDSLINIALCILGVIPGLLHAWYIVARYQDPTYDQYGPVGGDDVAGHNNSHARGVTYYYVRSDAPAHPLRKTDAGTGTGNAGGYGTIGLSSPAPMLGGTDGSGSQFPAQQHGKINPYAVGSSAGGQGIPDGHLKVMVQASDEDTSGAAGAYHDDDTGAAHAPPSYTATVRGDHKIQRD